MNAFRFGFALTLVALLGSLSASAAEDSSLVADSLFREGRRLMDAGQIAEGCRKLEESQRIEAAAGTLLALATCHEKEGKLATAYGEFADAMAVARRDGRSEREAFAREHMTALKPRLPQIRLVVSPEATVEGLQILRNGTLLAEPAWGVALPCNPGKMVISVQAPRKKPWTQELEIAVGQSVDLTVPALEDEIVPVEPVALPSPPVADTAVAAVAAPVMPSSRRRVAAWIGAASLVPLALGGGFGIAAIARQHASDNDCPYIGDRRACSDAGADANRQARSYARLSDVGLGLGLAGGITAAILYWTAPTDHNLAIRVVPLAGREPGAAVIGLF